jgi:hypothetical protein
MTLIEALYEAEEVELINAPEHQQRVCTHRISLGIIDISTKRMRAESDAHVLDPQVTCFPFAERGLLFDIYVKWWFCPQRKSLTFCWPKELDFNVTLFGMDGIPLLYGPDDDGFTVWDCPIHQAICKMTKSAKAFGSSFYGTATDANFRIVQDHIEKEHMPAIREFNAQMREIAGVRK